MRKEFTTKIDIEEPRTVTARISTACVDRVGDVMNPQGMDATDFLKSPTVFWCHDYQQPIGKCVKIWREDDAILAKTVYPDRPEDLQGEWLPDTVFGLIQAGVVNGHSIGFDEIEGGTRYANEQDTKRYGPECRRIFSKWKLLEFSVAPMPCNQEALTVAVNRGLVSPIQAKAIFGLDIAKAEKTSETPAPVEIPVVVAPVKRVYYFVRPYDVAETTTTEKIADAAAKAVAKARGRVYYY